MILGGREDRLEGRHGHRTVIRVIDIGVLRKIGIVGLSQMTTSGFSWRMARTRSRRSIEVGHDHAILVPRKINIRQPQHFRGCTLFALAGCNQIGR